MSSNSYPKLELKYCERCGGLWLRPRGTDAVYCAPCADEIAELPPPRGSMPPSSIQAAYISVTALFTSFLALTEQIGGAIA